MTVLTGTPQTFNLNADGSMSLTVPADAEAIVVAVAGLGISSSTLLFDELNFADDASIEFTQINAGLYAASSFRQIENHILTTADAEWPGTGAQTLYHSAQNGYSEGFNVVVFYAKEIDTASPIFGTDAVQGNTLSGSWDSNIAGVGANDLHVLSAFSYQNIPVVNATNQTEVITPSLYNDAGIGVAYEKAATSMNVTSAGDLVPTAFVLRSAPLPQITDINGGQEVYRGQVGVVVNFDNMSTEQVTDMNANGENFSNLSHVAGAASATIDVPVSMTTSTSADVTANYTE